MKNKYQKTLNDTANDESGLTEYEKNFIRNPDYGPYKNDDIFDKYYRFEFFRPKKVDKWIDQFKKSVIRQGKIPLADYEKIEKGILAFTKSSITPREDSALLYKSMFKEYPDLILKKYKHSDESIKQLVQENYFETFDRFDAFDFDPEN